MSRRGRSAAAAALVGALFAGWRRIRRADARAIAADSERALLERPLESRSLAVESFDGTVLHVEVFGPENAPTIVMVHGWVGSLAMWVYQVTSLAADHRIVAYDLRGHARSSPAASGDYSADALAADLDAVLRTCVPAGERALVVGHSLGAMSIVAWAGAHPEQVTERVAAAVLLNTGIERLVAEAQILLSAVALRGLKQVLGPWLMGLTLPAPKGSTPLMTRIVRAVAMGPRATPAQVVFCEAMFLQCRPDVRAAFGATLAGLDLAEALSALVVPTVVVAGELDRLTPPVHSRAIASGLADAELIVLGGTGHTSPLEAHHEVDSVIRTLAARTSEAPRIG